MSRAFTIEVRSVLRAAPDEVWKHASTMEGVNFELGPWVRMMVTKPGLGDGGRGVDGAGAARRPPTSTPVDMNAACARAHAAFRRRAYATTWWAPASPV